MAQITMTEEASTPSAPGSTKWSIYPKSTGMYYEDDAGVEYPVPTTQEVLRGGFENFSPADGTTYYFGSFPALAPNTGANTGFRRMSSTVNGTIKKAHFLIIKSGVVGTSETGTLYLRKNDTTDYSVLTTELDLSTIPFTLTKTGLSISVTADDFFEWKWVAPSWATNATGLYGNFRVFVE